MVPKDYFSTQLTWKVGTPGKHDVFDWPQGVLITQAPLCMSINMCVIANKFRDSIIWCYTRLNL